MGEIGISRQEFLHGLRWWEVSSIFRGYNRRYRHLWSSVRWQTYQIMMVTVGSDALAKNGIHQPTDLLVLPWEHSRTHSRITDEEVACMQADMAAWNMNQTEKSE